MRDEVNGAALRADYVRAACEAWCDALDDATWIRVGLPASGVTHHRWRDMTVTQRSVMMDAMGAFIAWVDSRRF